MIKKIQDGTYKLIETESGTKLLCLGDMCYAWIRARNIGEILITTHQEYVARKKLSSGRYALYDVADEADLYDMTHLELEVGDQMWQGYLLLTGLPTAQHKRARIIATEELITRTNKSRSKHKMTV